jgi:prolipoprotein diacylglyceryltransferase/protein-S-isoprenylcysteine O-methyltransferase Ste14/membrane-associated phospholipid phosphatase
MTAGTAGRLAYAAIFCAALPAALVAWAVRLDRTLPLPAIASSPAGWWLAAAGFGLAAWSMAVLRTRGGGLPMNAFPPPRPVRDGPYAVFAHPIYVGAVAIAFGVAFATGSAAGAWIVAPALALGCVALVHGYERDDLVRRFGRVPGGTLLSLPACDGARPTPRDVASVWLALLLPFLALYEAIGHLPVPDAIDLGEVEPARPIRAWTVAIYTTAYPFALVAPLAFLRRDRLRDWILDARLGMLVGFLAFLVVPVTFSPRPFDADSPFGSLLALERSDGLGSRAACPSFHVFWAAMSARAFAARTPVAGILAGTWALAISVSCVTTGMHGTIDVVAGAALAALATGRATLASLAVASAERIAHSWREWRIGPVRILSHSLFAGLAASVGILLVAARLGTAGAVAASCLGVVSLVGACLWGQWWTGSKRLLRPFGYFGSVLAVAISLPFLALAWPSAFDGWALAAALALAAPWIQAIGRFRCLVQGCCHGRPCDGGLRYRHPRSRVVSVAGLAGVPVHPTPLYSMAANAVIGLLLARWAAIGAPCPLVVGAFLILSGLARFVEESLRGEPQTQVVAGLRLYQWCAIASVLLGAAATCVAGTALPPRGPSDPVAIAALTLATGLLHAFAMGVDFPTSDRRFARLADA